MEFSRVKDIFELLSFVTVIVGLPVALYQYVRLKRYETYHALDEKYLDFMKLCFENPKLDIFDIRDSQPEELSPQEKKQELIAYTMLFSIFERAFVMYGDKWGGVRKRQWDGWEAYIDSFRQRKNFRDAWEQSGKTFDVPYQEYMDAKMLALPADPQPATPAKPKKPSRSPRAK